MKMKSYFSIFRKAIFTLMLVSISGVSLADWSDDDDDDDRRKRLGFRDVMQQLELVTAKLGQVESQLAFQQAQLSELQQETIDCTLDRYLNNQCGEGNTPFDLVVSICGNLGGEVSIGGNYAIGSETALELGAGWDEVIDVDLGVTASMPVVLTPPFLLPVVLPSEVSVGEDGSVGLGMDSCLEGIKIPIGKNVDRNRVITLLSNLEMGAADIQSALLDAIDNTYNNQTVAAALSAKDSFA